MKRQPAVDTPPRPQLHQVLDSWSPYTSLPPATKGTVEKIWRSMGLSKEFGSLLRYEMDMSLLRMSNAISLTFHRQVARYRNRTGIKVHLGCGNTLKPGWLNVDCYPPPPREGCEMLVIDMRRRMPFTDGSVDCIYSEHFFEHVPIEITREVLLPECYRILAPGGVIRVGVPDAELWINAYVAHRENAKTTRFVTGYPTPMMSVNVLARNSGHCCLWDYQTLQFTFAEAGFRDLRKTRAGDTQYSQFTALDQVDPWRIEQTVYIEGRRL